MWPRGRSPSHWRGRIRHSSKGTSPTPWLVLKQRVGLPRHTRASCASGSSFRRPASLEVIDGDVAPEEQRRVRAETIYDLTYIRHVSYSQVMSLRYAILGFLSVQPMSGYDLKKAFDGSVGHFWTADQAQIYRTLTQLIEGGLVESSHVAQQGKPDRKEHRLTDVGRAELDDWLASPEEPLPTREPFLLRVFFAGRLGRESVLQMLAHRLE